jgi:hypothetical protein
MHSNDISRIYHTKFGRIPTNGELIMNFQRVEKYDTEKIETPS